jgi:uncharacterized membrane protein
MKSMTRLIGAFAAGAAGMYLLDRDRGRRRRAIARDKLISGAHHLGEASEVTARDLANRARGTAARLRSLIFRRPVSDHQIAERIRSTLGFVVRHPRAIDVRVEDGGVMLTGPILADEVDRLLAAVRSVAGVRSIENHLRVHREPGNEPALQGGPRRPRRGRVFPMLQRVWSPTTRLFAVATGGTLALWGLGRRGPGRLPAGLGGLALLVRGATNLGVKRLLGIGSGRQAVTLQKTINIDAPVERVFEAWSRYEDFPKFMSHVREVRRTGEGRTHWVVSGPGGLPIEWDTEESVFVSDRVIGWRSVPGSIVEHAGIVRFDPNEKGGTRVHLRTSWTPPAGALGYGLAAILGSDPKRALDEDLVRFKSLMEDGKTTAHGHRVTRDEVAG